MHLVLAALACAALALAPQAAAQGLAAFGAQSVLQYHRNAAKDGFYVDSSLAGGWCQQQIRIGSGALWSAADTASRVAFRHQAGSKTHLVSARCVPRQPVS